MHPLHRNRRQAKRRKGAVLVEFAICAPLLFMFFFAALEFSRANMLLHSAGNAAYEGARRGIVPGATAADVRAAAQTILDATAAKKASVTVTPSVITQDTTQVTVAIDIPFNANSWFAPYFFKDRNLAASLTLSRELYDTTSVP